MADIDVVKEDEMDLKRWITGEYGGIRTVFNMGVLNAVPKEKLAEKPSPGANSIAWLVWHLARTEDVAINSVVRGIPQVLTRDDWPARLGISRTEMGTGFSDDEVADFSSAVNIDELLAYWQAVGHETEAWLRDVEAPALDEVPDVAARLAQAPAFVSPAASWVTGLWANKPASFFLGWVTIGHAYLHIGEMQAVRGQLGIKGM